MPDSKITKSVLSRSAPPSSSNLICREVLELLGRRRSIPALQLAEPGPTDDELNHILSIAMRVPDHGSLEPWRFIVVKGSHRDHLANKLISAFGEKNRDDDEVEIVGRKIRGICTSAPLLIIVVSCPNPSSKIPEWEQMLSAGAVCMNLITAVAASGYDSTWLTGWPAYDARAMKILGLGLSEKIAGIIPIGTASRDFSDRERPSLADHVKFWVR